MTTRRLGLASLGAGLLLVVVAQLAAPGATPPLYDGIVPITPYQWLTPPPDHPGGAQGVTADVVVDGGQSGLIAVATPELSPQAQVFATPGSLTLPTGATSVKVSIQPVPAAVQPSDGYIDGNVYRISVTDQQGRVLTAPAEARVSVVLRSADPTLTNGTIARQEGDTWTMLDTSPPPAGSDSYLATVTSFGDFAVIAPGTSPYPSASTTPSATAPGSSTGSSGSIGPSAQPTGTASVPPLGDRITDRLRRRSRSSRRSWSSVWSSRSSRPG